MKCTIQLSFYKMKSFFCFKKFIYCNFAIQQMHFSSAYQTKLLTSLRTFLSVLLSTCVRFKQQWKICGTTFEFGSGKKRLHSIENGKFQIFCMHFSSIPYFALTLMLLLEKKMFSNLMGAT